MSGSDENESKRLRSCEPDLQVHLGSGEDMETRLYHSTSLASKSKYIDGMLAGKFSLFCHPEVCSYFCVANDFPDDTPAPMRESETHMISFPDITVGVWDQMMQFLDSPSVARNMVPSDVMKVASFYDKYIFTEGIKLCDSLLIEYFKSLESQEKNLSIDVSFLVSLLGVAKEANLFGALKEGVGYIWTKFHSYVHCGKLGENTSPYKATMFTEDHLQSLSQILLFAFAHEDKIGKGVSIGRKEDPLFIPYRTDITVGWTNYGNQQRFTLHLDAPDFAQQFVNLSAKGTEEYHLHRCIGHIKVTGENIMNGVYRKCSKYGVYVYRREPKHYEYPRSFTYAIAKKHFQGEEETDWAIIAFKGDTFPLPKENRDLLFICWTSPYSQTLSFPPKECWTRGPDLDRFLTDFRSLRSASPKLSYMLNERML